MLKRYQNFDIFCRNEPEFARVLRRLYPGATAHLRDGRCVLIADRRYRDAYLQRLQGLVRYLVMGDWILCMPATGAVLVLEMRESDLAEINTERVNGSIRRFGYANI